MYCFRVFYSAALAAEAADNPTVPNAHGEHAIAYDAHRFLAEKGQLDG
jgi:hypothetical protein